MTLPGRHGSRIGIALWRARPLLIAALASLALIGTLQVLAPPPPEQTTVVVAARGLPAGARLSTADLATTDLPIEAAPEGAFVTVQEALGARLAHPVPARGVLTQSGVMVQGTWGEVASHEAVVPVRLADPAVAALLPEAAELHLVAASGDGARTLTTEARLVARIEGETADPLVGSAGPTSPLLIVVIPADVVTLVLDASAGGALAVALGPSA